jgi:glutaredoxin 3
MNATIYTKTQCTFCVQAKTLMTIRNIKFEEINLETTDGARESLMEACAAENVVPRTVPQIWLDGEYIGGFTELKARLDATS